MLVEDGRIEKKRGHEEPPPGQAGRDVREGLQPGLAHDLRLLTRFARLEKVALLHVLLNESLTFWGDGAFLPEGFA